MGLTFLLFPAAHPMHASREVFSCSVLCRNIYATHKQPIFSQPISSKCYTHACMQLTKKWHQTKPALETLAAHLHGVAEQSGPSRKTTSSSPAGATATQGQDTLTTTSAHRKSHAQILKQAAPALPQRHQPGVTIDGAAQQQAHQAGPGESAAEELQKLLNGIRAPAREMHAVLCGAAPQQSASSGRPAAQWPVGGASDMGIHTARHAATGGVLPFGTPLATGQHGVASPSNPP